MSNTIVGISSMATRHILDRLVERYETASGIVVTIRAMGGVDAAQRVRAGEAADVVLLASGVLTHLEGEGLIAAGTISGFARSGMAIAVREGAPRPDISDEAAVRRAVSEAARIAYSTGPSGDHLLKLCARWGLFADDPDRLVKAPPGVPVGSLIADGTADLGVQQLSELIGVPGIAVLGSLPADIQSETIFAAGVSARTAQPAAAEAFIAFLRTPSSSDVIRANGMEPIEA